MFGKLRGRLDQVQGKANLTMDMAQGLIRAALEDLEEIMNGVSAEAHLDEGAMGKLMAMMTGGKAGKLPIRVSVDPNSSTYPRKTCEFVGGPYDGDKFKIDKKRRQKKTITLPPKEEGGANAVYLWDGYKFMFEEESDGKSIFESLVEKVSGK